MTSSMGKPFKLEDLSSYPVLLPNKHTAACKIFLERLKELNIELNQNLIQSIELDDVFSMKTIARSGRHSRVSQPIVEEEIRQGQLEILPIEKDMTVNVEVIVHSGITVSSGMRQLTRLICEEFNALKKDF